MRVSSETDLVDLAPGSTAEIALDVVNTGSVIDGVTARVFGLPDRHVTSRPTVLPLFPEAAGRLTLTVGLPSGFPAGRHPVTVEVSSRRADTLPAYVDVELIVPNAPGLTLSARPQIVRAHRIARYLLTVTNQGNTPLDVALAAEDPERAVAVTIEPPGLTVGPASAAEVLLTARGPRMLLGTEIDRLITVTAIARILCAPPGAPVTRPQAPGHPGDRPPDPPDDSRDEPGGDEPLTAGCPITLKQRPWITRGLLTALILVAIVALWAGVFLFGVGQVFRGDPTTKAAPASFFLVPGSPAAVGATQVPVGPSGTAPAGTVAGATGSGAPQSGGARVKPAPTSFVPAGALPKDGTLPPGLAGTITGTVTAKSSGAPVGRILVEALRRTANGALVTVSSAATQGDGSYQVSGLFPSQYLIRFSAKGFRTIFAPAAASAGGARPVSVTAGGIASGSDVVIAGLPATIKGSVDRGDTTTKVVATVTVQQLTGSELGKKLAPTRTDANGAFTISGLPAPNVYQLTFSANGYRPTTVRVSVDGGARRLQPTVPLGADDGSLSGTVTDGRAGLGEVTVTTSVKGVEQMINTPTTGTVGAFVLDGLPTPATYVVTFSGKGFTPRTEVFDLKPGERRARQKIALVRGSGDVTGILRDTAGSGLGGATVTVGGGPDLPGTTTLTEGAVGSFSLSGLPSPGSYTMTFTLPGYADHTIPLVLEPERAPAALTVTMARGGGTVTGRVLDTTGTAVEGATVVATDGQQTWPVTSTAASGGLSAGGYVISGMPAGTYTITATGPSGQGRTALVTLAAGAQVTQDFAVPGGS